MTRYDSASRDPARSPAPPAPVRSRERWSMPVVVLPFLFIALALLAHGLAQQLPVSTWPRLFGLAFDHGASVGGIGRPVTDHASHAASAVETLSILLVRYGWLPRVVIALIAGGALSLAGVIFQQVLRNPLAEPLTLGVASGGYLALTVAAVVAPALVADARFAVAFGGAAVAMLLTMAFAARRGFSSLSVILAGMIVNLYCGAVAVLLTIVYERSLTAVFIWGGGVLSQSGWQGVLWLLPRVLVGAVLAALLIRPLRLFSLDDAQMSQLGLRLAWIRPLALTLAVLLSASVVSAVGVIGFIGLAGPALARLVGARRLRDQLLWAPVIGALLLLIADQVVQALPPALGAQLPTGAAIALLGGPLLLWMLHRFRLDGARPETLHAAAPRRALHGPAWVLTILLLIGVWLSLHLGRDVGGGGGQGGWTWADASTLPQLMYWRWPRLLASLASGIMLALAGTLLQRVTGNPMASPELLGVSGGAMVGTLLLALSLAALGMAPGTGWLLLGASAGALLFLAALLAIGRRRRFAPGHVLLGGIALSAFAQAVIVLATASGGAYATLIRPLLYGSTYLVSPGTAVGVAVSAVLLTLLAMLCARWLDMLPLGGDIADGLGMDSGHARLVLLLLSAVASAAATLIVGPMSFVGLMAPHLARLLGFNRARSQLWIAALIGAVLMVLADWLGRNVIFPQQMPAGILATLIGGPYLLWLLQKR
ncbi:Fe(3+)-hydroxamate ABC transporter permease FhuB [Robbsia andropogonis]|nr:Fe(3+)-hydroxamate ABC transporter permease FhuB [Robbsia andropogonis]MCP1120736.1 Fe(3+)-hydroxamate ABC transporter permease FhuB [Robbsia andropogonis]MCP1130470.1 Fe(3+)-hydroxamate ABC transporter permease FhuB [Robbsia andropogonis]